LQKTHCQGQIRLVMIVATGPGPQPHSGSSGHFHFQRRYIRQPTGFGHSSRFIMGHSLIDHQSIVCGGIFDEIEDRLLPWPLYHMAECVDGEHLVRRHCGVHAAGNDDAVRVNLFEHPGSFLPYRESIAAHIHQQHLIALHLAVVVHDGAQQPQAVILPLLMGATRMYQVAQVAQVDPQNLVLGGTFPTPRP